MQYQPLSEANVQQRADITLVYHCDITLFLKIIYQISFSAAINPFYFKYKALLDTLATVFNKFF